MCVKVVIKLTDTDEHGEGAQEFKSAWSHNWLQGVTKTTQGASALHPGTVALLTRGRKTKYTCTYPYTTGRAGRVAKTYKSEITQLNKSEKR